MKRKRVRSSAKPNRPQGHGSASDSRSHRPQGHGSASDSRSHSLEKAKEYAFLLLKFRLRTEKELLGRLRQKGFPEEVSQGVVNFLKDRQFINDCVFAKGWICSRLKRPFGLIRIRQELVQKGLDKEVIEEAVTQAKEDYQESDVVRELAEQRFLRLKGIDPLKARQRIYAYLMRRGFPPDLIREAINRSDSCK